MCVKVENNIPMAMQRELLRCWPSTKRSKKQRGGINFPSLSYETVEVRFSPAGFIGRPEVIFLNDRD